MRFYLSFWIIGGRGGGQRLQVWGWLDGANQVAYRCHPCRSWLHPHVPSLARSPAADSPAPFTINDAGDRF